MAITYQQRLQTYASQHNMTMAELRASPFDMANARGHGQTPEHGRLLPKQKTQHIAGRTIRISYSDRVAERAINTAAKHGHRVQIKMHTLGGQWRVIGGAGRAAGGPGSAGYSASYIKEKAKTIGLRKAVTNGSISGSGGGNGIDSDPINDIDADDIDAWQIDELE